MATLPKIVTYEEWLEMPVTQDGREEVVNGEIRIMPPNKTPHPYVVDDLTAAFRSQLDRKRTICIGSTFGLVIRKEPLTCRSPDIAVFDRQFSERVARALRNDHRLLPPPPRRPPPPPR